VAFWLRDLKNHGLLICNMPCLHAVLHHLAAVFSQRCFNHLLQYPFRFFTGWLLSSGIFSSSQDPRTQFTNAIRQARCIGAAQRQRFLVLLYTVFSVTSVWCCCSNASVLSSFRLRIISCRNCSWSVVDLTSHILLRLRSLDCRQQRFYCFIIFRSPLTSCHVR